MVTVKDHNNVPLNLGVYRLLLIVLGAGLSLQPLVIQTLTSGGTSRLRISQWKNKMSEN
ncbi:MAG: hypothetical protein ACJAZX_000405 [Rickettsiales bacterium]|jgi:hypothetical protein